MESLGQRFRPALEELRSLSVLDGAALARYSQQSWYDLFPVGVQYDNARRALHSAVEARLEAELKVVGTTLSRPSGVELYKVGDGQTGHGVRCFKLFRYFPILNAL